MKTRLRAVISAVALAAACASAPAGASGVPVIDPSAIAKIRETISVATKQLGAIQQQVSQVTQMRNTIGQIGPGMLGNMLKETGLDFSSAQGVLRDVRSMSGTVNSLRSQASNLKLPNEGDLKLPEVTNLASGRQMAESLFFYNGGSEMDSTMVTALRNRRNAVLRDAAVNAYGAATSMKSDMTKSNDIADKLSAQAQSATDLRGDVQANTAAMLAIYTEITKQTALVAASVEVQSAQTLAVDATGKSGKAN